MFSLTMMPDPEN